MASAVLFAEAQPGSLAAAGHGVLGEGRRPASLLSSALSPVPEEEPPSSALASVVQHLPLELMDGVVRNLSNDDSVTDSQMLTAISRWDAEAEPWSGLGPLPLFLSEAPSPGWDTGLDLESEGPGPHACSIIHPFLSPALCLAWGWMWGIQRAWPGDDAVRPGTSSVTLDMPMSFQPQFPPL